ncbi:MAG TPA: hypothetical protein VNK04_24935 [Gemmataceae bacterium]|nr:hypothetical protein [Gemmataceae bacterium]
MEQLEDRCVPAVDPILEWNGIALEAVRNDYALGHVPDQGGPTAASRALAIVHLAMFDALNSVTPKFTPYLIQARRTHGASRQAAVAQAAHDTLVALFPQQTAMFDAALDVTLARVPDGRPEDRGVMVGRFVADAILHARANDNSDLNIPHTPIPGPGHHQEDPLHPGQGYLSPKWGRVTPFAIPSVEDPRFRPLPPPPMDSMAYAMAFTEVAAMGGDGVTTPTFRTREQTLIGLYWGYDGSPGIGVPPRLYNQIARVVADQQGNTVAENARLFALLNVAMADGGIVCWDAKYDHDFWRPIVAIRNADIDGNPFTQQMANWAPLGAPRSNAPGETNFTPPFPAYTSGHATFGAASFRILANFYHRDDIRFTFISDELNGVTRDQDGSIRPLWPRTFTSFSQAAEENGQSRIYLGIHWSFDKTEGIRTGNAIADYTFNNFLRPLRGGGHRPLPSVAATASAPDAILAQSLAAASSGVTDEVPEELPGAVPPAVNPIPGDRDDPKEESHPLTHAGGGLGQQSRPGTRASVRDLVFSARDLVERLGELV